MARAKKPKAPAKRGRPAKSGLDRDTPEAYAELFRDLAQPPDTDDPVVMAVWCQKIQARGLVLLLEGRGNRPLNEEIRAFCNSIRRLVPMERLLAAEKTLGELARPVRPKWGKSRHKPEPEAPPATVVPIRGG